MITVRLWKHERQSPRPTVFAIWIDWNEKLRLADETQRGNFRRHCFCNPSYWLYIMRLKQSRSNYLHTVTSMFHCLQIPPCYVYCQISLVQIERPLLLFILLPSVHTCYEASKNIKKCTSYGVYRKWTTIHLFPLKTTLWPDVTEQQLFLWDQSRQRQ